MTYLDRERTRRKQGGVQQLLTIVVAAGLVGASVAAGWHFLSNYLQSSGNSTPVSVMQQTTIGICHGGDRKARRVTCIVDGDTGWEEGIKWRLYGVDTPELGKPACGNERSKAIAARDRLRELMRGGYRIEWMGSSGNYGRKLVRTRLADGRSAGKVLMQDNLAQPWPNSGNVWCS